MRPRLQVRQGDIELLPDDRDPVHHALRLLRHRDPAGGGTRRGRNLSTPPAGPRPCPLVQVTSRRTTDTPRMDRSPQDLARDPGAPLRDATSPEGGLSEGDRPTSRAPHAPIEGTGSVSAHDSDISTEHSGVQRASVRKGPGPKRSCRSRRGDGAFWRASGRSGERVRAGTGPQAGYRGALEGAEQSRPAGGPSRVPLWRRVRRHAAPGSPAGACGPAGRASPRRRSRKGARRPPPRGTLAPATAAPRPLRAAAKAKSDPFKAPRGQL